MLTFGVPPILECSSKGDKRFSALFAKIKSRDDKTIEEIFQTSKVFVDGEGNYFSCENWKDAKGKKPINGKEVRELYSELWLTYFEENPELVSFILQYNGFSDIFGQVGHACQAEEIYHIQQAVKTILEEVDKWQY